MNYIKQLQKEVRAANYEVQAFENGIADLVRYLNSPKFSCNSELDGYVNVKDVLARIETIKHDARNTYNELS